MEEKPLRVENEIEDDRELMPEESESNASAVESNEVESQDAVATDEDIESRLRSELEECRAKADEYLDGWQRARAEFANARKRLEKQRAEIYQLAAADFSRKLLPVVDDFSRAIDSVPEAIAEDNWFEGISLVQKKVYSVLEDMKVEPIEALGQPFDPNFHEALSLVEADGYESGTIVEELQTGYRLGDLVIRPSLVNVAS